MKKIQTIWVLGLGGVGGYFGGRIAHNLKQNNDIKQVYFIARGQHLKHIQANGLKLQTNNEQYTCYPAGSSDNPASFPTPDLILLCPKSYGLEEAVASISPYLDKNTIILPLMNGLDIYERIRSIITTGIVLPACVYITSYIEQPGVIFHKGPPGRAVFGRDKLNPDFDSAGLLEFSQEMKLDFNWVENPYPAIWEKYLLVASFALVTAASGLSFGEVMDDPEERQNLINVMHEILSLADKKEISLPDKLIDKTMELTRKFPHDARSSYQRDLEQGRRKAEGDIFGLTIVRLGRETGTPTPYTEKMLERIAARFPLKLNN